MSTDASWQSKSIERRKMNLVSPASNNSATVSRAASCKKCSRSYTDSKDPERAVCSGAPLSANRISGCYRLFE